MRILILFAIAALAAAQNAPIGGPSTARSLHGRAIDPTAPTDGQALVWDAAVARWKAGLALPGFVPTAGYIPFGTGTTFSQDSGLFWDNANKRLGIGTTAPNAKLEVSSGTSLPVLIDGTGDTIIQMKNAAANASVLGVVSAANHYLTGAATNDFIIRGNNGNKLHFGIDNGIGSAAPTMTITSGNVGIGTTSPTSTIHNAGSLTVAYRAITTLRTLDATDYLVDCTTGTYNVTLPTAVGISGRTYVIKNTGSGVITVATTLSQTIDASSTQALTQWSSITVTSNGSNWLIQ